RKAEAEWAKVGLFPTPPMVAKITALAAKTDIGMQVLGSARDAVRGGKKVTGLAIDASGAVIAGATETLGTAADLANLASSAGVDPDQLALDAGADPAQLADRAQTLRADAGFDVNGLKSIITGG